MSAPTSSSASTRSLCLISTPLTRATTASDAEGGTSEEEFLEQSQRADASNSARAVVASTIGRRRDMAGIGKSREIMAWSLHCATVGAAGQLPERAPLGNHLEADFDENVGAKRGNRRRLTRSQPPPISRQTRLIRSVVSRTRSSQTACGKLDCELRVQKGH